MASFNIKTNENCQICVNDVRWYCDFIMLNDRKI